MIKKENTVTQTLKFQLISLVIQIKKFIVLLLQTFPDISQTKFEQEKQVLIKHREKPEEAVTLLTFIEQFTDADHHAK